MANNSNRFLSALVKVTDEETPVSKQQEKQSNTISPPEQTSITNTSEEKFKQYFDQLLQRQMRTPAGESLFAVIVHSSCLQLLRGSFINLPF
jgi:hypothetical protein